MVSIDTFIISVKNEKVKSNLKNVTKHISLINTTNDTMHFVTFLIYASSEKNRMLACRFGEHRDNSRNSQSVFLVVSYENILFSEKLIYCNLQSFQSQPLRKRLLPDHHRYQLLRTALLHFLHLQIRRTGYG